jgi:oligoribonuclease NrnB/cAMP/cGMP phosphodiesterase (DHH superfamily)
MLAPENIDIVIYHHPCADGFTSCMIANLFFSKINKNVEYWGLSHSHNGPPDLYQRLKDKNVLICDFSFKKEIIMNLLDINMVKNLLIIDHHISAQKDLQDIEQKYKIFDMSHCGAYLTWQYFFPEIQVPLFVKYIEDNDIWLKAMPKTLEVTAYVASLEFEFVNFEKFICDEKLIYDVAIPMGSILLKQAQKQIDGALSKSTVKMIDFNSNIYFVAICNSAVNVSEIGNQMLTKYSMVDFSAVYSFNDSSGSNTTSFRSDDTRANVSVIATKCGGGGHRNASGCCLFDKTLPGFEIGDYNCYKQLRGIDFIFGEKSKISGKKYNYAILNTSQNKNQFIKYLLQTRTLEKKEKGEFEVQEACFLYRMCENNLKLDVNFDLAVAWNYGDKKTWVSIHWAEKICAEKYSDIRDIIKNYKDLEIIESKRIVKFSLPGLNLKFL